MQTASPSQGRGELQVALDDGRRYRTEHAVTARALLKCSWVSHPPTAKERVEPTWSLWLLHGWNKRQQYNLIQPASKEMIRPFNCTEILNIDYVWKDLKTKSFLLKNWEVWAQKESQSSCEAPHGHLLRHFILVCSFRFPKGNHLSIPKASQAASTQQWVQTESRAQLPLHPPPQGALKASRCTSQAKICKSMALSSVLVLVGRHTSIPRHWHHSRAWYTTGRGWAEGCPRSAVHSGEFANVQVCSGGTAPSGGCCSSCLAAGPTCNSSRTIISAKPGS